MVKEFDIKKLTNPTFAVVFGRKNAGKTCLLKDIMNSLMTPNDQWTVIDQYNNLANFDLLDVPEFQIKLLTSFDNDTLANNMKDCEHAGKQYFVFDDPPFYDEHFTTSSSIKSLIKDGKTNDISSIMTFNVPIACKLIEKNVDYIFILKDTSELYFRLLCERYFCMFKKKCKDFSYDVFKTALAELDEFECLVIDRNVSTSKIDDYIFKYKAIFIC